MYGIILKTVLLCILFQNEMNDIDIFMQHDSFTHSGIELVLKCFSSSVVFSLSVNNYQRECDSESLSRIDLNALLIIGMFFTLRLLLHNY